jgi:hypothetical protein
LSCVLHLFKYDIHNFKEDTGVIQRYMYSDTNTRRNFKKKNSVFFFIRIIIIIIIHSFLFSLFSFHLLFFIVIFQ